MEQEGIHLSRVKLFAALSDATRLRIVDVLRHRDGLSSSEIAELLGVSLALHCHHAKILSEAGIITKRKEGQTSYLSLNQDFLTSQLSGLL
ncbi:MAG: helix-turn-helix transcriptional regulator [Candidatus Sericytochromatia bacterium]|nr:helix-turn-helix transcriptional regulator [Candidatus Sericytochromatia bacterium]